MRQITLIALALAVFFAIGNGDAAACGKGKLIFADKFASLDAGWKFDGSDDDGITPGPNGLVVKVHPGNTSSAIHQPERYDNFEICTVFEAHSEKGAGDFVAVRFWTPDGNAEYWAVTFTGQGWYVVNHYLPGQKPQGVTPDVDNPSWLKDGMNEVDVSLTGNQGTFSVNGKKVGDFTGEPPEGGSVFGFALYSGKNNTGASTFVLKSIEVHEVAPN